MTTYELCLAIRWRIMQRAGGALTYLNWSNDFAAQQLRELPGKLMKDPDFKPLDLSELTSEQMDDLGFGKWDEGNPLRLIPVWLFPFLPDEVNCGSIDWDAPSIIKKVDMDNDSRCGCLAYGVYPATK